MRYCIKDNCVLFELFHVTTMVGERKLQVDGVKSLLSAQTGTSGMKADSAAVHDLVGLKHSTQLTKFRYVLY